MEKYKIKDNVAFLYKGQVEASRKLRISKEHLNRVMRGRNTCPYILAISITNELNKNLKVENDIEDYFERV